MKNKTMPVIVTSVLAILGWFGICAVTSKTVGKGVNAFISRNPKSRGRQFAGGFIIGLFMAAIHFLGKYLGGMIGDTIFRALEYEAQETPEPTKPADRFVNLNTEEDDEDDDVWEPSIEMEPKTAQV